MDAELQKGPVHRGRPGERCPRRGQWRAQSMEGMGQPAEAKHVSLAAAMTARAGGAGASRVRRGRRGGGKKDGLGAASRATGAAGKGSGAMRGCGRGGAG